MKGLSLQNRQNYSLAMTLSATSRLGFRDNTSGVNEYYVYHHHHECMIMSRSSSPNKTIVLWKTICLLRGKKIGNVRLAGLDGFKESTTFCSTLWGIFHFYYYLQKNTKQSMLP